MNETMLPKISSTWVVTFHFNRGNAQVQEFSSKTEAAKAIEITVFNNEDCINCSIYRRDIYC